MCLDSGGSHEDGGEASKEMKTMDNCGLCGNKKKNSVIHETSGRSAKRLVPKEECRKGAD